VSSMEAKVQSETSQSDERAMGLGRWPDAKAHRIFWSIVIIGTGADLWSKWAIFKWLESLPDPKNYSVIDGLFKLVMVINRGAAFGIAQGKTGILVAVSVIALAVVVGVFVFGRVHQRVVQVALALFAAGISGNLYDRAFNGGGVRDFLDVKIPIIDYPWPAFNVADSMLCTAVGLLLLVNITSASSQKHADGQK
jgi:signal peptidase II